MTAALPTTVVGVFTDRRQAEETVADLRPDDFPVTLFPETCSRYARVKSSKRGWSPASQRASISAVRTVKHIHIVPAT